MADFEVATGTIFTGGVSHCCPTVQDCGEALAECIELTLISLSPHEGVSCK